MSHGMVTPSLARMAWIFSGAATATKGSMAKALVAASAVNRSMTLGFDAATVDILDSRVDRIAGLMRSA